MTTTYGCYYAFLCVYMCTLTCELVGDELKGITPYHGDKH